jgi:hypothetical protein
MCANGVPGFPVVYTIAAALAARIAVETSMPGVHWVVSAAFRDVSHSVLVGRTLARALHIDQQLLDEPL